MKNTCAVESNLKEIIEKSKDSYAVYLAQITLKLVQDAK
jgi:hypothetical protein